MSVVDRAFKKAKEVAHEAGEVAQKAGQVIRDHTPDSVAHAAEKASDAVQAGAASVKTNAERAYDATRAGVQAGGEAMSDALHKDKKADPPKAP